MLTMQFLGRSIVNKKYINFRFKISTDVAQLCPSFPSTHESEADNLCEPSIPHISVSVHCWDIIHVCLLVLHGRRRTGDTSD